MEAGIVTPSGTRSRSTVPGPVGVGTPSRLE
jgi:hypothetical protein